MDRYAALARNAIAALFAAGCLPALFGCVAHAAQGRLPGPVPGPPTGWIQGMFGLAELDDISIDPAAGLQPDELDSGTVPFVGAAWQVPLRGDGVRVGYEAGAFLGGRTDTQRKDLSGGGQIIVLDQELLLFDVFAGLSVIAHPSESVRLYFGVGPTFQYADVDTDLADAMNQPVRVDGSGFGLGIYARAGIDVRAGKELDVGLGVRWLDATIDVGRELGDLEYETVQVLLTFTTGF